MNASAPVQVRVYLAQILLGLHLLKSRVIAMDLLPENSSKSDWWRQSLVAGAFVFAVGFAYFTRDPADDALALAIAKAAALAILAWLIGCTISFLARRCAGGLGAIKRS